jgi:hypothetical protein
MKNKIWERERWRQSMLEKDGNNDFFYVPMTMFASTCLQLISQMAASFLFSLLLLFYFMF